MKGKGIAPCHEVKYGEWGYGLLLVDDMIS